MELELVVPGWRVVLALVLLPLGGGARCAGGTT